ncbi:40S ribosomal protein S22 [Colletotrichum simmondsii]|uniref:40S ribosomal protein S22 n=1 Tax=Colletotrichum simmondsii TaxID=703756 RepID=A0A135TNP5_9PEZI|nr:40S ribosomal protein S22 [Colletotrichum simmondsii]
MASCLTSRKSMTTEAAKLSFNSPADWTNVASSALDLTSDWVVRLLPAHQFGHVVLTTSAGIMDHNQARRKNVSGKTLGYFY